MGEPAGVLFLIDEDIVLLLGAETMAPHLRRAVIVVELDVEETLAVLAPDRRSIGVLDAVGMIAAAVPFAHEDGEIFRALDVGAPRYEAMIPGMFGAAEPEILAGLRKLVAVEHDLVRAAIARLAAEQLMLSALAEFTEIGVRPVRRGHAGIVFLDAAAHFRDQLFLQRFRCGRAGRRYGRSRLRDSFGCRCRAAWDRAAPPANSHPSARHNRH